MAQFYTISIKKERTNILFTGSNYFFYSNYFGLLAVVSRDAENDDLFHISVGNRYTVGGSVTASSVYKSVERFVTKIECKHKHLGREISFTRTDTDLANYYLSISLGSY